MLHTIPLLDYQAFGLAIQSEIPLPELPPRCGDSLLSTSAVTIAKADLTRAWRDRGESSRYFAVRGIEYVLFHVPEVGIFCMQDGRSIQVSPFAEADEDRLRLYLLGTCMGIILLQRGILPLHGSAIAINGKAYAILGESGAGKSTLAAVLMGLGYRLLSDDVIPIVIQNGTPMAIPAYPQQKLWQESLTKLGIAQTGYQPIFNRENKFTVPVQSHFHPEPLPLGGVFELVKSEDQTSITPIGKMERFPTLLQHTYRKFLLERTQLMQWHFQTLSQIVTRIDAYRLTRSESSFSAHRLASFLLHSIRKEES